MKFPTYKSDKKILNIYFVYKIKEYNQYMNQLPKKYNQEGELVDLHLDTNGKIAFIFIQPYMLDHCKMEKIYKSNYNMLMYEYKKWCDATGGNCQDMIPFIYHFALHKLNLSELEVLQFQIYMREKEYNLFTFDSGHLNWFADQLFNLVTYFIDEKFIEMERAEIYNKLGKCMNCDKYKNKCKNKCYDDQW